MSTYALRRLALGFASMLALAGAARAGEVTYPQLGTATTVQDTDLIATWRASGPLTKVQASVLEAYLQGKLSPLFLNDANNLSDLANVGTARTNLGLGSAALAATGTTGTALCQLNSNCTWTGTEAFNGKVTVGASTAAGALFNLTPGAAPTSPVNGDLWDTSTGLFVYLNSASNQIAFLSSNVASATQWQTARSETLTGDVTGSVSGINGTGNWVIPTTLANSGVGAGTYGDATHVAQVTVNAKGIVTGASSQSIAAGSTAGSIYTSNGTVSSWAPRLSAYFSGCSATGCALYSGTGISGVSRAGTGLYTVNFTTNMPDGNYTVICTAGVYGATAIVCHDNSCNNNGCTHVVSGVALSFLTGAGAAIEPNGFNVWIIHN